MREGQEAGWSRFPGEGMCINYNQRGVRGVRSWDAFGADKQVSIRGEVYLLI